MWLPRLLTSDQNEEFHITQLFLFLFLPLSFKVHSPFHLSLHFFNISLHNLTFIFSTLFFPPLFVFSSIFPPFFFLRSSNLCQLSGYNSVACHGHFRILYSYRSTCTVSLCQFIGYIKVKPIKLEAEILIGQYPMACVLIGRPMRQSRGTYCFIKKQRDAKIGPHSACVHVFLTVCHLYSSIERHL